MKTMATITKTEYPCYRSPEGREYQCIGWAIDLRINWEWYAFKCIDMQNEIYEGYVMGFCDEYGDFSVQELRANGIRFITDVRKLRELRPPIGWKRIA